LLPIIFVVTFFDILAYFGILTWMIDKIGWVISKVSRLPKLESFFSIQMMFLGNTEALAVIRGQLAVLKDNRLLTFGIMSMSSISGSILGSYLTMVPATYVFTAIPLNCLNALILASILNPVEVTKDEDIIYVPPKEEKKDFFSTISNSMMVGMNMVIVILSMVIGYVALTSCLNGMLGLIMDGLTIQKIFSYIFSPFAFLLGLAPGDGDACRTADGDETRNKRIRRDDGFKNAARYDFAPYSRRGHNIFDVVCQLQYDRNDLWNIQFLI
jgi:purine nucleoside transport protein